MESYSATSGLSTRTVQLSYDNANRVTIEQETATGGNRTTVYGYDSANNRTSKSVSGSPGAGSWTFTYNELNQLISSFQRHAAGFIHLHLRQQGQPNQPDWPGGR